MHTAKEFESTNVEKSQSNSLGVAGLVVSVFGLICCITVLVLVITIDASTTARQSTEPENYFEEFGDTVERGTSFVGRAAIFTVGGLIGGTLSVVGFGLSIAGLTRSPNSTAIIGVIASRLGPSLLMLRLLFLMS